jgi:hypothetical protein
MEHSGSLTTMGELKPCARSLPMSSSARIILSASGGLLAVETANQQAGSAASQRGPSDDYGSRFVRSMTATFVAGRNEPIASVFSSYIRWGAIL